MAVHLSFFLILTGLTGIHSITTVSQVSVKSGNSISIPCLYGSQYTNHVKYLCKGYYFHSCSYSVKTNQRNSEKFSISDDKEQRIFNVTINDVMNGDTDYWCAVEINGGTDVEKYFHLSVTTDKPRLYVDHQEITGFIGDEITISCFHRNSGGMKWCRLGGSCVTGSSRSIDGTSVTINARHRNVFYVTMRGLRTESSGWYLCVQGDFQMPVHLTVTEKPTTVTATSSLTPFSPAPESVNPPDQPPITDQDEVDRGPVELLSFIIPLSLLIFTVMVTLFIWFMLKRQKRTKVESSATTTAKEDVTYSNVKKKRKRTLRQAEEEVTYSDVKHVRGKRPDAEMKSDEDVTYSSVFAVELQTVQSVQAKAEEVTYSTLAYHQQNL